MPLLSEPNNHTCFYCGGQACYVSVNTKIMRCVERITSCPGFVSKAEASRKNNISAEERREQMIANNKRASKRLSELHKDPEWLAVKSNNISKAVSSRGGHRGSNNPMFGRKHSEETKNKLRARANKRNSSCYDEATKTKIQRGIAIPKEHKSEWELYEERVDNATYKSWKHYQHVINPTGLVRGEHYELDHKFSKVQGFLQGVEPDIIGHYHNLELLPKRENRSKRTKCSILLDDLYSLIHSK